MSRPDFSDRTYHIIPSGSVQFLDFNDIYKKAVDQNREKLQALRKENPASYITGDVIGSILAPSIPIVKALKGTTALGKILIGTGSGATTGALETAGRQKELNTEEITNGALIGGAIGVGLGGAGGLVQKAIGGSPTLKAIKIIKEALTENPITTARAIKGSGLAREGLKGKIGKKLWNEIKGKDTVAGRVKQTAEAKDLGIEPEQYKDLLERINDIELKQKTNIRPTLSPEWDFPVRKNRKGMKE